MSEEKNKKGFSGLGSLASEVGTTVDDSPHHGIEGDKPTAPMRTDEEQEADLGERVAKRTFGPRQEPQKEPEVVAARTVPSAVPGWFWGLIGLGVLVGVFSVQEENRRRSTGPQNTEPTVSRSSSPSQTPEVQTGPLESSRAPVGEENTPSAGEMRSGMATGTTTPVIEGGTLDFDREPTYGSAVLSAGFVPDPHTLMITSGGEVAASYLGGECTGYAAVGPNFRMTWSGSSSELRIFFAADDGGDTTLLVNLPDGSWVCNDDAPGTVEPMVVLPSPSPGRYDVWVGSFSAGAFVPGTLHVTERNLDPLSVEPAELDYTADPHFGSLELQAGFAPDPNVSEIVGGGDVDATYLGGGCVGHASQAPDVRLTWSGASDELRVFFTADEGRDASLLVNLPDGSWVCNDDAGSLDPLIVLTDPAEGQYDIWVGSLESGHFISGALSITERELQP